MNNRPFQWRVWLRSKMGLVTLAFLAIAAFYLITEHTAHVLGVLPLAIFLLCPLLMLFMHGGHGDEDIQQGDDYGEEPGDYRHQTGTHIQPIEDDSYPHEEIK